MGASDQGGLIPSPPANPTLTTRLAAFAAAAISAQRDRWRLWAPVAFGGGCGTYFALPSEPTLWTVLVPACLTGGFWLAARRWGLGRSVTLPLMLLACFALGLAVAKARADRVDAPVAPIGGDPVTVQGWVLDVDSPGARGARVLLAPVVVDGLMPEAIPLRLKATVRGPPPPPGTAVRLFALLNPPPPPASPGSYDFGRDAYFQGLGGSAFALAETRAADLAPSPWRLRVTMAINAARYHLAQRIVARLGERTGGIAAAMTTGHEAWIAREDLEVMRDSGLAHILSISGLHMAIVGGFVFFATRLAIAAWPWLALRASGKKIAAGAGLVAVLGYLILSGSPPPAERAAVTAAIAFLAILLDRRAISMHALAVAAFVVLWIQPEAVVTPGFQMSFAATAALVALVESWPSRSREISVPLPIRLVQGLGAWIGTACLASLVAGLATGPFAMQHFNRVAMFGLIANLATAPISSFLMMPALALGAALEPLGLGAPFLVVAGWGVDLMLAVGTWTAALPGAVRSVASAPDFVLPIAFLGLLFVCLWSGRGRWVGLPFAAAVMLWPRAPTPDVWIGDGGTNAAYRVEAGAVLIRPGVRQFGADLWSRRRGVALRTPPEGALACARSSCAPAEPGSGPIALWWGRSAPTVDVLADLCRSAEIISSRASLPVLPPACDDRLVLDATDHARGGAVELWRATGGWSAVWASDLRGDRPWSRAAADLSDSGG